MQGFTDLFEKGKEVPFIHRCYAILIVLEFGHLGFNILLQVSVFFGSAPIKWLH